MKNQIDQARWLAVLAVTGIGLYLCWLMLKPFIGVLAWAIVLVIVFHPVHRRLARKIRYRGLSALLSCLLVIPIVILPLTLLTISVAQEVANVAPAFALTDFTVNKLLKRRYSEKSLTGFRPVSGSTHCGHKSFL